jgi:superfamily II RNA helicase
MNEEVKIKVVEIVAQQTGVDYIDIMTHTRKTSEQRHLAMYIMKKILNVGWSEIGRFFKYNHATVIHGCESVENRIETDYVSLQNYKHIRESVKQIDIEDKTESAISAELFRKYAELKHSVRRLKEENENLKERVKILESALSIEQKLSIA